MIIPDLNLIVYAYNGGSSEHAAARKGWEGLMRGSTTVGLPWVVIVGFIRLTTTRNVFAQPCTVKDSLQCVESWLAQPVVMPLNPGPRHFESLKQAMGHTAGGALTTDAHLAALAIEFQAELHSGDTDFARFPGLRWKNPLAKP